jgi:FKBP-type peptidyl-prolyl cis-trans isomerase FklB
MIKYFWAKNTKNICLVAAFLIGGLAMSSPASAQDALVDDAAEVEKAFRLAQTKFLVDYSKKEGFIMRPGGMLVKRVRAGTGKFPAKTQTVMVNYKGSLADGTVFDSSYARNQPTSFGVTEVIKGWQQALLLMREGSKWEVVIPSSLGYGEFGSPPVIPPHASLHFEVELISVTGAK